jgi:hypothetical protein
LDDSLNASILRQHEKSKRSFAMRKDHGFGLRPVFWEKDMLDHVMSAEKASNLGYVRILDYKKSRRLVLENHAI